MCITVLHALKRRWTYTRRIDKQDNKDVSDLDILQVKDGIDCSAGRVGSAPYVRYKQKNKRGLRDIEGKWER